MQQSSINEKHTQAQGMWFQLLKKQKKKYKKYKNSVVIRTEGKRESKNTRVWANTTESRNWTNQRRKLELTCVRGPQETRGLGKRSSSTGLLSKGSSEVCVVGVFLIHTGEETPELSTTAPSGVIPNQPPQKRHTGSGLTMASKILTFSSQAF